MYLQWYYNSVITIHNTIVDINVLQFYSCMVINVQITTENMEDF